jgi:hypothetical protein
MGLSPETISKKLIEQYKDTVYTEIWDYVRCWFEDVDEFDNHTEGYPITYKFMVDGKEFIARGYVHSDEKYVDKYYIIGIDLGSIDRWDGTIAQTNIDNAKEEIKTLVQNEEWKNIIQKSEARNCTYYSIIDFGVQHPKYDTSSIGPSVHITKDDCDCCS